MVSQETLVTQRKHNWRHCLHEIKSCKACIFNTQINKFYAPVGLKIRDRLNSVQVQRITRRRYAILCHFQRKGSMATQIGDLQVVICSKRNKTHVPFQLNEFSNRQPSQRGRTRHPQKFKKHFSVLQLTQIEGHLFTDATNPDDQFLPTSDGFFECKLIWRKFYFSRQHLYRWLIPYFSANIENRKERHTNLTIQQPFTTVPIQHPPNCNHFQHEHHISEKILLSK